MSSGKVRICLIFFNCFCPRRLLILSSNLPLRCGMMVATIALDERVGVACAVCEGGDDGTNASPMMWRCKKVRRCVSIEDGIDVLALGVPAAGRLVPAVP